MALTQEQESIINAEVLGGSSPLNAQYVVVLAGGGDPDAKRTAIAALLNDVSESTNRTLVRKTMSGREVLALTDWGEFGDLSDVKKQLWISFTSADEVDSSVGGAGQQIVQRIFPPGGLTTQALASGRIQGVSRVAELAELNGISIPEIKAGDLINIIPNV